MHDGVTLTQKCEVGATIREVLKTLHIHPSTVLAVHEGVIVPHDSRIESEIRIETVIVSSGG